MWETSTNFVQTQEKKFLIPLLNLMLDRHIRHNGKAKTVKKCAELKATGLILECTEIFLYPFLAQSVGHIH